MNKLAEKVSSLKPLAKKAIRNKISEQPKAHNPSDIDKTFLRAFGYLGFYLSTLVLMGCGLATTGVFFKWNKEIIEFASLFIIFLSHIKKMRTELVALRPNGPAHLYLSDLLVISLTLGLFLALLSALSSASFLSCALLFGPLFVGLTVIALLYASRCGLARGLPRMVFALGCASSILARIAVPLILFYLVECVLIAFKRSMSFQEITNFIFSSYLREMLVLGLCVALGVLLGARLRKWARLKAGLWDTPVMSAVSCTKNNQ